MEEPSVKLMLQPGVLFFRCYVLGCRAKARKRNEREREREAAKCVLRAHKCYYDHTNMPLSCYS